MNRQVQTFLATGAFSPEFPSLSYSTGPILEKEPGHKI